MSVVKLWKICLVIILIAGLSISCSQQVPQIIESETGIVNVLSQDTDTIEKHLVVYLHLDAEDEDHGIAKMVVSSPEAEQVSWTVDIDHLFTRKADGEIWIGTNAIVAPSTSRKTGRFGSGTYTVLVVAENGLEDSTSFKLVDSVQYSERTKDLFPTYDPESGLLSIKNPLIKEIRFRGYDDALNPLGAVDLESGTTLESQRSDIESLLGRTVTFFEIEVFDNLLKQWFRTGYFRYE